MTVDTGTNATSIGFITELIVPPSVSAGATVTINTRYKNIGSLRDRVTIRVYDNTSLIGLGSAILDPGQETPFGVSGTPTLLGTHTIKAEAYSRANGVDHLDHVLQRDTRVI